MASLPEPDGKSTGETEKSPGKSPGLKAPWQPGQSGNPKGRPRGSSMAAKIQKAFDRYCREKGKRDWADWLAWMAIENGDQQCLQIAAMKAIPNAPQDLNINHEFTPTDEQLELIALQRAKLHAELRALDNVAAAGPAIAWRERAILLTEGGNGRDNGKD